MTNTRLTGHQIADLSLILILASLALIYLYDAYQASPHIMNLILILPITVLLLLLCSFEFVKQWLANIHQQQSQTVDTDEKTELEPLSSVIPVILFFVFYILTLQWLGFDVGTFIFISSFLWYHGERRWLWVIGYGFGFALTTSLFFSAMLPYPLPMLILETAY